MLLHPGMGFESQTMQFLAYRMRSFRRFQSTVNKPFVVIACCGESLSIEDVVHAEPSVISSVSGIASSWNHYS